MSLSELLLWCLIMTWPKIIDRLGSGPLSKDMESSSCALRSKRGPEILWFFSFCSTKQNQNILWSCFSCLSHWNNIPENLRGDERFYISKTKQKQKPCLYSLVFMWYLKMLWFHNYIYLYHYYCYLDLLEFLISDRHRGGTDLRKTPLLCWRVSRCVAHGCRVIRWGCRPSERNSSAMSDGIMMFTLLCAPTCSLHTHTHTHTHTKRLHWKHTWGSTINLLIRTSFPKLRWLIPISS